MTCVFSYGPDANNPFHRIAGIRADVCSARSGTDGDRMQRLQAVAWWAHVSHPSCFAGPRSSAPAAPGPRIYATLSAPPYPLAAAAPGDGPSSPVLAGDDGRASDRSTPVDPQVFSMLETKQCTPCPCSSKTVSCERLPGSRGGLSLHALALATSNISLLTTSVSVLHYNLEAFRTASQLWTVS